MSSTWYGFHNVYSTQSMYCTQCMYSTHTWRQHVVLQKLSTECLTTILTYAFISQYDTGKILWDLEQSSFYWIIVTEGVSSVVCAICALGFLSSSSMHMSNAYIANALLSLTNTSYGSTLFFGSRLQEGIAPNVRVQINSDKWCCQTHHSTVNCSITNVVFIIGWSYLCDESRSTVLYRRTVVR